MKTKTTTTLPDKPSELIRIALKDLRKCEKDPRYKVDMDFWHAPNGKCKVCFAGAVMAKRLGVPINVSIDSNMTESQPEYLKLLALDYARLGWARDMATTMGCQFDRTLIPGKVDLVPYENNPAAFKRGMRAMADLMESHGL